MAVDEAKGFEHSWDWAIERGKERGWGRERRFYNKWVREFDGGLIFRLGRSWWLRERMREIFWDKRDKEFEMREEKEFEMRSKKDRRNLIWFCGFDFLGSLI